MSLVTIQDPAAEPVLLDELKAYLRVDASDTSNDSTITALAKGARFYAEHFTRRRFITQKVAMKMDFFPGYIGGKLPGQMVAQTYFAGPSPLMIGLNFAIVLPYPPVQSIDTFSYLDPSSGTPIILQPNSDYIADLASNPARLTPPYAQMWPVARVEPESVSVNFTCGYGPDGSAVPEPIKIAIKQLTLYWYENRIPNDENIPKSVTALLWPYRNLRF
jgi:hypothetical protein